MNDELLKYISCPSCNSELIYSNNNLGCDKCKIKFEEKEGIPILINLNNLPRHLDNQIKYFENEKHITYKLDLWQKNYVDRFLDNFNDVKNKLIIDCGTGSGYMAIELAKRGATVIACDLTLKNLIRLKKISKELGLEKNILYFCSSAEDLPLKKGIADFFISNAVLEHLPNEKEAINEIKRVCTEKAGLMITVPIKYRYLNPILIPINFIHDKRIGHLRRYSKEELEKRFNDYIIKNIYYTGHTKKVIKIIFNNFFPIFDEKRIEDNDNKKLEKKFGASNIIIFMNKV